DLWIGVRHIQTSSPRTLSSGSVVDARRRGAAVVFFRQSAKCRLFAHLHTSVTLLTRPSSDVLFRQFRGETFCTIGNGKRMTVGPGEEARRLAQPQKPS